MEKILVTLYIDFNQSKPWSSTEFEVEFNGDKARVYNNGGFGPKVSRFNQVRRNGKTGVNNHYSLSVNGYKVYFMTTHNI
jgi:hypothetical protein